MPSCLHLETEMRARRTLLKGMVAQAQCKGCGRGVGPTLPLAGWLPRWQHKKRPTKRRREYQARLKRNDWKGLRERVFIRDNWTCRHCGEPATEVDHLNYARLGDERMTDLVSSCKSCNQARRVS